MVRFPVQAKTLAFAITWSVLDPDVTQRRYLLYAARGCDHEVTQGWARLIQRLSRPISANP